MKRLDIQGLRAIAILLVLLFHFYPQYAPNGYVGVDTFFVISGYLMAFLLRRPNESFIIKYLDFIYRRCKRIVPMAYLIFALTFLIMQLWFPRLAEENRDFSLKALLFYANHRSLDEEYETQLSNAEIVFTHYWSLAVEMQFYLFAPFIFWITTKAAPKRPAIPCVLLAVVSLAYSNSLSSTEAFNSTIARLWQFMSGYVAYFMDPDSQPTNMPCSEDGDQKDYERLINVEDGDTSDKEEHDDDNCEETKQKKISIIFGFDLSDISYGISIILLFLPFLPYEVPYCRAIATINSAVLIYLKRDFFLLTNRVITFLGDISYSLYLVHWPVLCFRKYLTTDGISSVNVDALYLIASVIIAIVLHYSFEKYYVTWSKAVIIVLSTVLLCSCVTLVFLPALRLDSDEPVKIPPFYAYCPSAVLNRQYIPAPRCILKRPVKTGKREQGAAQLPEEAARLNYNSTVRKILSWNYWPDKICKSTSLNGYRAQRKVCEFPRGDGNLTVLIVGNSYASNQAGIIYSYIKKHAATVTLLWKSACESIVPTIGYGCDGDRTAMKFIELFRPDVLFVVERYLRMKSPIEGNLLTDPTMVKLKEQIPLLEMSARKIFLIGAIPMVNKLSVTKACEWLKQGRSLETLKDVVVYDESPATKRLAEIQQSCKKCTVYDWGHLFNYNGSGPNFQYYDKSTEEMYFDDWIHLNDAGKKHIRPLYEMMGEEIGQLIRNKILI